jgi:hypothetical protein
MTNRIRSQQENVGRSFLDLGWALDTLVLKNAESGAGRKWGEVSHMAKPAVSHKFYGGIRENSQKGRRVSLIQASHPGLRVYVMCGTEYTCPCA